MCEVNGASFFTDKRKDDEWARNFSYGLNVWRFTIDKVLQQWEGVC
jgi:hypothetical protein